MKKKVLLLLMVGSIILPSVVFWGNPKHEVVAEKKEQTVNLNVVPHVNGHELKDFSKIDVDALKVGVSYFNYTTYEEFKLFSEQHDKNLVIRKIPKNTRGLMLYANNQEEVNEYGVRVKSVDFNYYKGKTVPKFESIDSEDPHYLNTKEDSYLAINYELKYDLKLNFENEEFANYIQVLLNNANVINN